MNGFNGIAPIWHDCFDGPTEYNLDLADTIKIVKTRSERVGLVVTNVGLTPVYVGPAQEVSSTLYTWKLGPGDSLELRPPIFTGEIWANGSGRVCVTEFFSKE